MVLEKGGGATVKSFQTSLLQNIKLGVQNVRMGRSRIWLVGPDEIPLWGGGLGGSALTSLKFQRLYLVRGKSPQTKELWDDFEPQPIDT